jgi:hypothetical protein
MRLPHGACPEFIEWLAMTDNAPFDRLRTSGFSWINK